MGKKEEKGDKYITSLTFTENEAIAEAPFIQLSKPRVFLISVPYDEYGTHQHVIVIEDKKRAEFLIRKCYPHFDGYSNTEYEDTIKMILDSMVEVDLRYESISL